MEIESDQTCNLLYFGDVVGQAGRKFLQAQLAQLTQHYASTFTFANAENAAGGFGLTRDIAEELKQAGIHALSLGNHTWNQRKFWEEINSLNYVCRPANFPPECPGKTYLIVESNGIKIALFGLLGRAFMNMSLDCPFKTAQSIINELKDQGICNIVVDIHAESTAEKKALAYFLAEQSVTAVVGTHTHVQTADEQLLKNTAFITDLGMCGPFNGILGFTAEPIITKSIAGKPCRFEVASGLSMLNGVSIQFNPLNGHAIHIERILLKEH